MTWESNQNPKGFFLFCVIFQNFTTSFCYSGMRPIKSRKTRTPNDVQFFSFLWCVQHNNGMPQQWNHISSSSHTSSWKRGRLSWWGITGARILLRVDNASQSRCLLQHTKVKNHSTLLRLEFKTFRSTLHFQQRQQFIRVHSRLICST